VHQNGLGLSDGINVEVLSGIDAGSRVKKPNSDALVDPRTKKP
jgi:hypothetical protein